MDKTVQTYAQSLEGQHTNTVPGGPPCRACEKIAKFADAVGESPARGTWAEQYLRMAHNEVEVFDLQAGNGGVTAKQVAPGVYMNAREVEKGIWAEIDQADADEDDPFDALHVARAAWQAGIIGKEKAMSMGLSEAYLDKTKAAAVPNVCGYVTAAFPPGDRSCVLPAGHLEPHDYGVPSPAERAFQEKFAAAYKEALVAASKPIGEVKAAEAKPAKHLCGLNCCANGCAVGGLPAPMSLEWSWNTTGTVVPAVEVYRTADGTVWGGAPTPVVPAPAWAVGPPAPALPTIPGYVVPIDVNALVGAAKDPCPRAYTGDRDLACRCGGCGSGFTTSA